MNISIEARSLSAKSGGVKTYTSELIKNITYYYPQAHVQVITGSAHTSEQFPQTHEEVVPLPSEVLLPYWLSIPVARAMSKFHPAVVHYTKAALPVRKIAPSIVTIYDVIPLFLPETQSFTRRYYWPRALSHAAKHADHIITISEQSKKDILTAFHIPEEKITVTPLAVDTNHFTPKEKEKSSPYILFVGTWDKRKNVESLVRAFAHISPQIPHTLIIAGRPAHKENTAKELVQQLGLETRVEFRELVPYTELPSLYAGADIFVWPSVYEGWAFPVLEAMACGTPVIVSNGGALPEVVGEGGVIVPFSTEDLHARMNDTDFIHRLSQEIVRVAQNTSLQQELRQKGMMRAGQLSWKQVADETWKVYTKFAV